MTVLLSPKQLTAIKNADQIAATDFEDFRGSAGLSALHKTVLCHYARDSATGNRLSLPESQWVSINQSH